jgi:hypothetical protein
MGTTAVYPGQSMGRKSGQSMNGDLSMKRHLSVAKVVIIYKGGIPKFLAETLLLLLLLGKDKDFDER